MISRYCFRTMLSVVVACFVLLFASCQSGPQDESFPVEQCTVSFRVTNYRQICFDDFSSSGSTRAMSPYEIATLAHLIVAVYDAETGVQVVAPIQHNHTDYEENPYDYPKFSVSLPYGRYRVLALGFNGTRACNIASPSHISWEEDYVPNTFLYCDEFTLDEGAALDQSITLKHAVAAFCVTAEDAIPADMKKMRFVSTAGGTVLDATTGFAPKTTGRTSEIAVPASIIGQQGMMFTAYLFLPEEGISSDYTVQALDEGGRVLNERHFDDVPLRINHLTMWKGNFFEKGGDDSPFLQEDFGMEWDINWADTLYYEP